MFRGDTLSPEEKKGGGAPAPLYRPVGNLHPKCSDLRIYAQRYIKELLREEGKSVALLDGRYAQDESPGTRTAPRSAARRSRRLWGGERARHELCRASGER